MIRYVCDACFESVEHDGPHLPPNWCAIVGRVDWGDCAGEGQLEQECNARLLCPKCRGKDQGDLCAHAERVLSLGLDRRPKEVPRAELSEDTQRLMRFYGVEHVEALIVEQSRHVERLQAQLPEDIAVIPARQVVREG